MFEAALLAIAAAALVVALSPLDVSFAVERADSTRATIGIRWIFLRYSTGLGGRKGRPGKKGKKTSRTGVRQAVRIFQAVPDKFGTVRAFLRRLGRAVRWRGMTGALTVGTGDPADTGQLWGILAPVLIWIDRGPAFDVNVVPNFVETGVTGTLKGEMRVYPSLIVWALVRLLVSPTAVRLALAVLRNRRVRR